VQPVIAIHIHIQPLHKRKILYDNAARMFPR